MMHAVSLQAHFDGQQILLDEPFELESDTKLIVTVLSKQKEMEDEREKWLSLSQKGLERAYDNEEVEYTLDMIKRANPDYDKRS